MGVEFCFAFLVFFLAVCVFGYFRYLGCMFVCVLCACLISMETEKGQGSPGTGVISCKLPCGHWK